MLSRFVKDAAHVYLACGSTDFRKQTTGLAAIVNMQFKLDPFSDSCAFIFCNKRKTAIKVLRYDKNGFILASKNLLDGMKFQWPKDPSQVKEITFTQVEWLLQGLSVEQKKVHHPVEMRPGNIYFGLRLHHRISELAGDGTPLQRFNEESTLVCVIILLRIRTEQRF